MTLCAVTSCTRTVLRSSICSMHRNRMARHGSYDVTLRPRFDITDPEQVKDRLLRNREIDPGGCWLWTGAHSGDGYGQVGNEGRVLYAHRLAAAAWQVPGQGPYVLHACDVPACFNPEHLRWGTQAQNLADAMARGRAPQMTGGV